MRTGFNTFDMPLGKSSKYCVILDPRSISCIANYARRRGIDKCVVSDILSYMAVYYTKGLSNGYKDWEDVYARPAIYREGYVVGIKRPRSNKSTQLAEIYF